MTTLGKRLPAIGRAARQKAPEGNWKLRRSLPLYVMLLPGATCLLLFNLLPMFGIVIAFQKFNPILGFVRSPFVGLQNFQKLFSKPDIWEIVRNTLVIATGKIVVNQLASLTLAILLNEVVNRLFKGLVQSITYLLNFLSWVILGGIILDLLSLNGIVNNLVGALGGHRLLFLGQPNLFQPTMILTDVWKSFGFGAVVYLAALTGIDPRLHEAAAVDGANRFRRIWHINLSGILPTVVLLAALNLGSVLDAGFDQILILYNPLVYDTGDIIDTFIYREGFRAAAYSLGASVGLLRSVVGMILIGLSFWLAKRLANYRVL